MSNPALLVGYDSSDDAAVYRVSYEVAVIETVDFFTPIVDDPYLFGQIAAANALSDVYAMGGEPKLALNIMCLAQSMDDHAVQEILRGGYDKAYEAGAIISRNPMLTAGWADYVQLADSPLSAAFCTSHQRGRAPRLPHLRGYGRTFGKDPAANLRAFVEMPLRRVKPLYVQDSMLLYSRKCFLSSWFSPSTSSVISASSTVSGEMFTSVLPFRFTPRMLTP